VRSAEPDLAAVPVAGACRWLLLFAVTVAVSQTIPGKGWFTVIRFYNPLPSFFDKTWRPSEIEPT